MTGILIPLAEISGGAASRARVEAPQGGRAVAAFGASLAAIGDDLTADRLEREMGRVRVEMARTLGEKRLEFEAMTDPDEIDTGWQATEASLRETFVGSADPRNAERITQAYDEMAGRHALALGGRAIDLRQGAYRTNVDELGYTLAGQAAVLDPETRAAGLDQYADAVAAAVAAGAIDPEDAARLLRGQRDTMDRTAALRRLDEDPEALIGALDGGEFAGLDPVYAEGLRARATSAVASRAASAEAEAERIEKARRDALNDELREIARIGGQGRLPAQVEALADPEAAGLPAYGEAMAAVELLAERPRLDIATVAELDAAIAEEEARPIVRAWQNERLTVLRRARDEAAEGWGTDPIGFAQARGMRVPDLPEFDAEEAPAFATALRARAIYAGTLEAQGYGRVPVPLSREEAAALREATGVDADPDDRVALAQAIGAGLGPQAAREIADDPVFGWMAGFTASGGSAALAREAFRGQAAMAADNVVLPPLKDRLAPVFDEIDTLIADLPGGEAMQAEITAAADALYSARMRRQGGGRMSDPGVVADIDADVYAQALHEVLGGTGSVGRRDQRGGVQELRGARTILPPGVAAEDVETALARLGTVAEAGRRGETRAEDGDLLQRQLAAIAADGRVPMVDGQPLTRRDLGRAALQAAGNGVYLLTYEGRSLRDETGAEYRLSLPALLREGAR